MYSTLSDRPNPNFKFLISNADSISSASSSQNQDHGKAQSAFPLSGNCQNQFHNSLYPLLHFSFFRVEDGEAVSVRADKEGLHGLLQTVVGKLKEVKILK